MGKKEFPKPFQNSTNTHTNVSVMTQITRQVPVSVASPNLPDKGSQAVNYRIVRQSTQGGDLEGVLNQLTRPVMDGKFIRQGVERREWLVLSK
ncbi:MAG: hypothetical protein CMI09_13585, partial [Oceanospirillaceae bacterium]|nr:hypothetical protein [Oceanospirillaceae bacterium]